MSPHFAKATALALGCMLLAAPARAQRTDENAVKAAEDAFGVTIGRETLGLYTTSSVRGFSPTVAGNARIDGLYFDQVWALNSRLRRTTTIRIGPSAQSYPFPAPTGIVDQAFKAPGGKRSTSLLVSGDEWGTRSVEADAVLPLTSDKLGLGIGAAATEEEYYNGTSGSYGNVGASIRWNPTDSIEIVPFGVRSEARDDEFGPIYVPARTLIDVGARYRFSIGAAPAVLRFSLTNVTDEYGYDLRGSGAYDLIPGRRASAYITVDW